MAIPPRIRVNVAAPFPAMVTGQNGIALGKQNGIWTVQLNIPALQTSVPPVGNYNNDYIIVYDSVANTYSKVALASIAGSSGGNVSTGGLTNNEVVFGSGATSIQSLGFPASNGQVLTQNTTGAPFWSNAGTGNVTTSVTLTTNNVVLGSGGSAISALAAGTNGQVLTMVSGAPAWQTSTAGGGNVNTTGLTPNEITYANGASTIVSLGFPTSNGQVLTQNTTGAPFWSAAGTGTGNVTASGTLTANQVTVGSGGTAITSLAAGTNGQVLTVAGGVPTWLTPAGGGNVSSAGLTTNQVTYASGAANILSLGFPVINGMVLTQNTTGAPFWSSVGNVTTPSTLTANQVIVGNTGTAVIPLAAGANGQVLTISSGTPTWQTPASSSGNVSTAGLTTNEVTYASGANNIVSLGFPASNGQVLTQNTSGAPFWSTPAAGVIMGGAGPSHRAGYVPDPGATNFQQRFLNEQAVWVPAFGAANVVLASFVGDGVTVNSASAFNAFWANNPLVYFPRGTYLFNGTLLGPAIDGAGIIGDGMYDTVIKSNQSTGDVITCSPYVNAGIYKGFTVTRTGTATSGAGINTNISGDKTLIREIYSANSNVGFLLAHVSWAECSFCIAEFNRSYGFQLTSTGGDALQWQLHHLLSQNNGGDGFNCSGTNPTPVGNWSKMSTFNNTGRGFVCAGLAALRMSDCFFGGDGAGSEFYIVSGGATYYPHILNNIYCELPGPGGGLGFQFDPGVVDGIVMHNCAAINCVNSGILHQTGGYLSVMGGGFVDNGTGNNAGNWFGILCISGTLSCAGVISPASGTQRNGIVTTGGCSHVAIVGCNADVSNNAASAQYIPAGANW